MFNYCVTNLMYGFKVIESNALFHDLRNMSNDVINISFKSCSNMFDGIKHMSIKGVLKMS